MCYNRPMLLFLLACSSSTPTNTSTQPTDNRPPEDSGAPGDSGGTDGIASWTFAVFMNGDNNLESYVSHDLNELEQVGSQPGVHVVVQADRIDGYDTSDGDWTGTRRYYIEGDDDRQQVSSPMLEDLGELDMGDPAVLSDFLMWAQENYPAERMAVILWDHGDGWAVQATSDGVAPPSISSDDTSESGMSIGRGELAAGLAALVDARGPIDVVGFDACNMASWEVGYYLMPYASYMMASEATVGYEGLQYGDLLGLLRDNPEADGRELAEVGAQTAVEKGDEWTFSAVDLSAMAEIGVALDGLAGAVLDDPSLSDALVAQRDATRGADPVWNDYYLDLGDFGAVLAESADFSAHGAAIQGAMSKAVVGAWGSDGWDWTGGLTVFFDLREPYVTVYSAESSPWVTETRWDDLLNALADQGY